MNEFTAKKLAEVSAFAALADDITKRSNPQFELYAPEVARRLSLISAPAIAIGEHEQLFALKVDKTVAKLTSMMELYIGDEWDNPVEVLEWLSFYAGAASAHADLATSALRTLALVSEADAIEALSQDFWIMLSEVKAQLSKVGAERATQ